MTPMSYIRIGTVIALLAALAWGGTSLYGAGKRACMLEHTKAAAEASEAARAADLASTTASESVADQTRATADSAASEARAETATTIETIRYVYRDRVVPSGCAAGPVPDVVRERFAASRAAAAAARGLPAAVGR